jgi:ankyrin repeat protein
MTSGITTLPDFVLQAISADEPHALRLPPGCTIDTIYRTADLKCRTLLQLAASHAAQNCVALLLEHGASVNLQAPGDGWTALHCACANANSPSSASCIALLLKCSADKGLANAAGHLPSDLLKLEAPQVRP